jgi:hypothetical protein
MQENGCSARKTGRTEKQLLAADEALNKAEVQGTLIAGFQKARKEKRC